MGRLRWSLLVLATLLVMGGSSVAAPPTDLFFSEYVEGTSNNKALEIYNGTGGSVSLTGYAVQMFFNGSATAGLTINLTGTVADHDVFVVAQSSASAPILAVADQTNGAGWFNGDDAVVLTKGGAPIDVIGQIGFDPGTEWGTGLTSTADNTLRRKASVTAGDANGGDAFDPSVEWDGFATDTFGGLGSHLTPAVTCGGPLAVEAGAGGSQQVTATDTDGTVVDLAITNVTPAPSPGTITRSAFTPAASQGGTATATVSVSAAVPVGSYSVELTATTDDATPQTGTCSLAVNVATPVPIHDIQGSSHKSPLNGNAVSGVHGVVTAKRANGFYLQDPNPDANDSTSEGIFVFTNSAPTVNVGDALSVAGTVSEFRAGGATSTNLTTTEITGPTISVLSTGNPLPAATVIGTGGRVPPASVIEDDATGDVETSGVFDPATDGIDFYESLEGMRVQVNDARAVGRRNDFGTNREIPVVGDNGANASLFTPRGGLILQQADTNPERIILNDLITGGPTLPLASVGDSFPGATVGVIDYSFGNFKLEVSTLPALVSGGIALETTSAATAGQLAVATFNVENLDPTDPPAKFSTLAGLIVNNLRAPDLISVEEVQDDNGATNDATVDATMTWNTLIGAIQAAGGPTYQFRQIDPVDDQDGGEPGGNIRQGFLYRTDRGLAFIDAAGGGSTTANSVDPGPHLHFSPGRIDPTNAAFTSSRKPLAGEFTFHGSRLFVIGNHLNSKGGDQPLFGHFQPPTLVSETQRNQQAQVINDFVDAILAQDANANVIVLGDLNDFQYSNPLATLIGAPAVLDNLYTTIPVNQRYSYVFEGNSQALDHILTSSHFTAKLVVLDPVHVNAEFGDQASDHDPLVARFCADTTDPTLIATATPSVLWPPNHNYRNVTVSLTPGDDSGATPTVTFVSATSSEPDNAPGGSDGNTVNDVVKVTDTTFRLRAERDENGSGRTYTITYRATDPCGNTKTAAATVRVPLTF